MSPYIRKMNLQRGKEGLGFILTGQNPCVISSVNQNSPAIQAGLKTGDEILEVNSIDVSKLNHDEVVKHILKYSSIYIELKVRTFSTLKKKEYSRYNYHSDGEKSVNSNNELQISTKKTKVKSFTIDNNLCSCDNNPIVTVTKKDSRSTKFINGDVNKLLNRRAFRHENYPEKKKNNRPCSFAAPSSDNNLCIIHEFKENHLDVKPNGYVNNRLMAEPLVDKYNRFDSPKISSLNPKVTTPARHFPRKNSEEIKLDCSFIVYYQCTIDLPTEENQNISDIGIRTLQTCVENIQNDAEDLSSIVLLSIGTMGVKLTNPLGSNIVTYPLNTVLYNFISSEDNRYFGLVTRKQLTDHSKDMSSSYKHSPRFTRSREVILCSCHVFMVDPNLANHDIHLETSMLFGVSCKQVLGICQQFPETPNVVLMELNSFYKKRDSVSCYSLSSLAISDTVSADKNTISSTLERLRSKNTQDTTSSTTTSSTADKSKTYLSTLERSRGKTITGPVVSTEKTLSASTLERARNRTISDSICSEKPLATSTLERSRGTNAIDRDYQTPTKTKTFTLETIERPEKTSKHNSHPHTPNPTSNEKSHDEKSALRDKRNGLSTPIRVGLSKTLDRTPKKKAGPYTPDKYIISNTLERIRGNVSSSSTPRDPRKLMNCPPSSLSALDDDEKEELIREIEARKSSQSEDEEQQHFNDYFQVNNNDTLFRRKSATESELFGNLKSNQSSIQALISSNLTQSLRSEYRKPPAPQRMYSVPKNLSDMSSTTQLLNGLKKGSPRRKSEAPTFSPKTSLKELFFKSNIKKRKKDTPPSNTRFYLKRDTNENVKQLSTSSASSELSLDGKTGRVESWSQSLEKLLSDAVGLKCFQEFLKKEFSEENLLFWVACERFKRMTDITQMKNVAHEISRNYLSGNAPFLVNVDSVAVKKTETELNTPHTDMFSIPQQQVFQLMKFDSYNRFLKSTLYQECLLAETSDRLFPYEEEMDGELRKNPLWSKSMKSPISDNEKRKNPLNFLNRGKNAKSPDPDKVRKERSSSLGAYDDCNRKNIVHPAEMNGHTPKDNQLWEGTQSKSRIVRVIMPDGTSGVIVGERGQTLREGLKELCEQKNFPLQSIDVTVGYDKKIANLDTDISSLHENIVYLERRILLRFDLPNGRSVGVKSSPNKTLREVLQPVMKTNGFEMDHYTVLLINTKTSLSLDANITTVENKRLVTKLNHRKLEKQNSDSAVSRIGAQGFRASFRKFRTNSTNFSEGKDDKTDTGRKTTRKKSDDGAAALMTVLQKSQSSRLDDQRGLISRDNEIPDFLKVTSSTPSPVRNKIVNAINNNLFNSTPLKTVHQYPGTPFIVDKNFKDLTEKLDLSLSSPMNLRGRPSLCSVRSWKELPSPDRELVDRSYTFDTSYTVDRTRTSADSINALSPATKNKIGLLELSKSDSSLLTRDSLINVSTRSSTEPNCSPGNSQKYISSKAESGSGGLNTAASDDAFRDRSVSCDNSFKKRNEKKLNKNSIRCNEHVPKGGRPLPINKFNESEILRCLDQDDTVIIATPEKKNSQQQLCDQNNDIRLDSGIDTNPSNSDNNLNNTNTDSESKDRSAKSTPTKFGLTLDTPKAQSTERIGSVDIVDYDLSPRSVERYRKLSLSDDMLMNSINRDVFEGNAVPTPEKGKLLKGETIRGRQNEKITFV